MTMQADDRAAALFQAVAAANPKVAEMTEQEQEDLKLSLKTVWGADLAYIKDQATIVADTFRAPAGASVATTGGPTNQNGFTTSAVGLAGTGKVT